MSNEQPASSPRKLEEKRLGRPYSSVRGAISDGRPYRDSLVMGGDELDFEVLHFGTHD
jgi:hypothetical protein